MRTISAVDLRNDLEGIVKLLRKGETLALTYRGETVAELKPVSPTQEKQDHAQAALKRIWARTRQDPNYSQKVEQYVQEVYEDRKSYGERDPG